ncbi:hypothetical protein [Brevibacillus daliensis]|uniref:hypothetical protein n=1 Tax=Brevibacillus daliensis TaxID=2892995 RepID=UPI001E59A1A0|nr:hypothetical protein [Brevibacillus daliensis]
MRFYKLFLLHALVLILMGCTSNDMKNNEVQIVVATNELKQLETQLDDSKKELAVQKGIIEELQGEIQFIMGEITTLKNRSNMNQTLLTNLPGITYKQGYIKEATLAKDGVSIRVDYAEFKIDLTAPNNFVIVNEKEERDKLLAGSDSFYVLNALVPTFINSEDFDKSEHEGLYNLYIIGNKVVLVVEMYVV